MNRTKVFVVVSILLFCLSYRVLATHIRAGDLTAARIDTGDPSLLTYQFTVFLYRDTQGVPAQPGLINFGTGNPDDEVEVEPVSLGFINGGTTEVIRYDAIFTFPSAGTFKVSYFERNRNEGINNMFNSNDTPFFIESTFRISPILGLNSAPVLLIPPVDEATVGQRYIHNPGAFDVDRDSLSYRLAIPRRGSENDPEGGDVIDYSPLDDPRWSRETEDGLTPPIFMMDPITGDLTWDAPLTPGEYNIAFFVDEWRDGILIGSVNRDMQIRVRDNNNNRPTVNVPIDTCIVAGDTLFALIEGTDPDNDYIQLTLANDSSGIFLRNPPAPRQSATFDTLGLQPPNGREQGIFRWPTVCEDISREPYQITFKVEDFPRGFPNNQDQLADLQTWRVKVIGPAPDTLIAEPDLVNATVNLSWDEYGCANADRMLVFRRIDSFPYDPVCETGLPDGSYEQIGDLDIGTTSFFDDNNGEGLERGKTYCYRIYAIFEEPAGGESLTSMEVCVFIPKAAPYITNVDIQETSTSEGEIFVRWTTPLFIDEEEFPRPYTYKVLRSEGFTEDANQVEVPQIFNEEDTFFVDTGLNTEELVYNYQVILLSQNVEIDTSDKASSVRLGVASGNEQISLDWRAIVPWSNTEEPYPYHFIYRKIDGEEEEFTLIDSVNVLQSGFGYVDRGTVGEPLEEGKLYCYFVRTYGDYVQPEIDVDDPLINASQIQCDSITIFIPPNAPLITNVSVEETSRTDGEILVRWTKVIDLDTMEFPPPYTYQVGRAVGFSGTSEFELLPEIFEENDTSFVDVGLNTEDNPYNYRIYFYSEGNLVDSSDVASSVRLTAVSNQETIRLSWQAEVPWNNTTSDFRFHYIFRATPNAEVTTFQLIDSVDVLSNGFVYNDRGAFNNMPLDPTQEYCYIVTTQGSYLNNQIREPLLNNSQEACAVLVDIIPPCLPITFQSDSLLGTSCDELEQMVFDQSNECPAENYQNVLRWIPNLDFDCDADLSHYNVYFKAPRDSTFSVLTSVTDTFFIHQNLTSIAGCYALTTVDFSGNESDFTNEVCFDNCPAYSLPNVFTPNDDGINDTFVPFRCPRFVESVAFKVFNRWGELVYESDDDIFLNWEGVNNNGRDLKTGLYYYIATVKFIRLNPEEEIEEIKGWVKLLRNGVN